MRWRRSGFTLIELLVVIAIIAVLIGLLLPAVQKVRERATWTQCVNNLKQIGIALQTFHDAQQKFPTGYTSGVSAVGDDTGPGWGWAAQILPMMEQGPLYQQLRLDKPIEDPLNAAGRVTVVKTYLCNSDNAPPTFTASRRTPAGQVIAAVADVASSNYVGVFGISEPGVDGEGIFFRNSVVAIRDITDGTSQTMAVGERSFKYAESTWVGAISGTSQFPVANSGLPPASEVAANFVLAHTGEATQGPAIPREVNHFSSRHSGGVNFVFADGHVSFLTSAVTYDIFRALSTRAGGESNAGGY